MPSGKRPRVREALRDFLNTEASSGLALLTAAVAALVWANLFEQSYVETWETQLRLGVGGAAKTLDLRHWINDALMAVFFLVVGLEIKRELVVGELRDRRTAIVPVVAAAGGMIGPALTYLAFNPAPPTSRGWGIPMATDIAFAVGVLAALGRRAPPGMKLFLLTLAIVDDIGAIAVIALVYTEKLAVEGLLWAAGGVLMIVVLRRLGTRPAWAYLLPGFVIWAGTAASGVHPTIAGVALGLATPARPIRGRAVLDDLQERLHPLSSFVVIPLFALANAGISVDAASLRNAVGSPVFAGTSVGLVAGKTLGITLATVAVLRVSRAKLPAGMRLWHVAAVGALGGIGFTVAIFIGELAFTDPSVAGAAKTGVLLGSIVSALLGAAILMASSRQRSKGR